MDSSDDDMPLIMRHVPKTANGNGNAKVEAKSSGTATAVLERPAVVKSEPPVKPPAARPVPAKAPAPKPAAPKPAAPRKKAPAKKAAPAKKRAAPAKVSARKATKRAKKESASGKGVQKWTTLKHNGVQFPPEYVPHGVKMLYDGKPVELTVDQEEVATMFAVMKETEYMNKPVFLKNFWAGFKDVLGKDHVIKSLDKCDFTPMYDYHMALREAKKEITKEEKIRAKEERDAIDAKYKIAIVSGKEEPVGNYKVEPPGLFRGWLATTKWSPLACSVAEVGNYKVEPPGLFRGRGEHPKMGVIKRRVYPKDVVINIGKNEPIPEHPYPGQTWKHVKHDDTVTWLAYWKDTVSARDYKYVFLGATSTFKADSDLAKYEKARKLKDLIGDIRKNYEADWDAPSIKTQQMGTALYFIDKLALRAGHEKDEDEADTVDNVEIVPPSSIKFDFLGKDSMRYENTVEVHPKVYKNMEKFKRMDARGKRKVAGDMIFDEFNATNLNEVLKDIMDGLSVKVFRTYNASIALDKLLRDFEASSRAVSVDEKKVDYDKANKEVAILCNHQRSVPKAHQVQMEKMKEKLALLNVELTEILDDLKESKKGRPGKDGKLVDASTLEARAQRKKDQVAKMELVMGAKEDLSTVALGTSKINYMDPRITVAWCKRNEVPIEKVFNKSLLSKFLWAMDTEPDFVW
eukprot:gene13943-19879_t